MPIFLPNFVLDYWAFIIGIIGIRMLVLRITRGYGDNPPIWPLIWTVPLLRAEDWLGGDQVCLVEG